MINKMGVWVRLPDGREGTTVYNGLDGVGIKFGLHRPREEDFERSSGGLLADDVPDDFPWFPDAMLRKPYKGMDSDLEYVGDEYEIIDENGGP